MKGKIKELDVVKESLESSLNYSFHQIPLPAEDHYQIKGIHYVAAGMKLANGATTLGLQETNTEDPPETDL